MLLTLNQLSALFSVETHEDGKTTIGIFDRVKKSLNENKSCVQTSFGKHFRDAFFKLLPTAGDTELAANPTKASLEETKKDPTHQSLVEIEETLDQAALLLAFSLPVTQSKKAEATEPHSSAIETKAEEEISITAETQTKLIERLSKIKESIHSKMEDSKTVITAFLKKTRPFDSLDLSKHSDAFSTYKKMDHLINLLTDINNAENTAVVNSLLEKHDATIFSHPFLDRIYHENEAADRDTAFGHGYGARGCSW